MAALGKWTGGAVSILPGTTWAAPAGMFPTEARNDGYTFAAATSLLTLPASDLADGYLIVGAFEFEDDSNGRCNPQARIIQASGTGDFVGSATSGYNRSTSEDRSYCRCWAFVDAPSASATFQFQWRRDTDAPTGGTERASFEVMPLYYADAGIFSSAATACPGNTTPSQVTGFSGTNGSAITLSGNVVTLGALNKRYLCLGGYYWQGIGNARTQRWGGFRIDGALDNAVKGYSYARNSANADIGEMFTTIVETGGSARTVDMAIYRGDGVGNLQGGADVAGNTTGSNPAHAIVVLELSDACEVFYGASDAISADLSVTGPLDLAPFPTSTFVSDAGSFTRTNDSFVNVEQDASVLLGANISGASDNVVTGTRYTAFSQFTVNGAEQTDSFAGDYLRNNQGSQDTFGWSGNMLGALELNQNQDIGVSVAELPGSGGGGNMKSPSGWLGVWGINLDTMQGGIPGVSLVVDQADLTVAANSPVLSQAHTLAAVAVDQAISVDAASVQSAYALTAQGADLASAIAPVTVSQSAALVIEPVDQSLTVDAVAVSQASTLALDAIDLVTPIEAIDLQQAAVVSPADMDFGASVDAVTVSLSISVSPGQADSAIAVDSPALVQRSTLAPAGMLAAATVDAVALSQAYVIALASASHEIGIEAVALIQSHQLGVNAIDQQALADAVTLTQGQLLTTADLVQEIQADGVIVVQASVLSVDEAALSTAVDATGLTQASALGVEGVTHVVSLDSSSVSQSQSLSTAASLLGVSVDAVTVTQHVVLIPVGADLAGSIAAVGLTQASALDAQGLLQAASIDNGDLTQANFLAVDPMGGLLTAEDLVLVVGEFVVPAYGMLLAEPTDSIFIAAPSGPQLIATSR